jgi:hypothetical protein
MLQGFVPRQLPKGHHKNQVGAAQSAHTCIAYISIHDGAQVIRWHAYSMICVNGDLHKYLRRPRLFDLKTIAIARIKN